MGVVITMRVVELLQLIFVFVLHLSAIVASKTQSKTEAKANVSPPIMGCRTSRNCKKFCQKKSMHHGLDHKQKIWLEEACSISDHKGEDFWICDLASECTEDSDCQSLEKITVNQGTERKERADLYCPAEAESDGKTVRKCTWDGLLKSIEKDKSEHLIYRANRALKKSQPKNDKSEEHFYNY